MYIWTVHLCGAAYFCRYMYSLYILYVYTLVVYILCTCRWYSTGTYMYIHITYQSICVYIIYMYCIVSNSCILTWRMIDNLYCKYAHSSIQHIICDRNVFTNFLPCYHIIIPTMKPFWWLWMRLLCSNVCLLCYSNMLKICPIMLLKFWIILWYLVTH